MATENIVWTLLPNGLDRDRDELRSTIFVTPRLRTGGGRERLDVFPSFQHWAGTVANLSFVAEVDGLGRFDLALDPELELEGRAREAIHQVNTMRKEAGLEITDRIALTLPPELAEHEEWIARETLAERVEPGGQLRIEKS